jgi:hypothetical protein
LQLETAATVLAGDLGWNRTCDPQLRRLLLYPLSYEAVSNYLIITVNRLPITLCFHSNQPVTAAQR